MISTSDAISILKRIKPQLEKQYKVHSMALFGSYARGEQTESSDIDILVDVDPSLGLDFIELADTIEKELGEASTDPVRVDLVSTRALKPRYYDYVKEDCVYV